MGRDLTKRYISVFERHRLSHPLSFAHDVFATDKCRELSSFLLWELLYKSHLFPAASCLTFADHTPLALKAEDFTKTQDFNEEVGRSFAGLGLRAKPCEPNWKRVYLDKERRILGCCYPKDNQLYESDDERRINFSGTFPEPIKALYVSSAGTLFVCVTGGVYRRTSNASPFHRVLTFASPESFFRHNNGMTECPDGTLTIGEYGNVWNPDGWKNLAFLYSSSDDGETWTKSDFLIRQGTNKHVHVVKYSRLLDRLLVADGDNYKKLWIGEIARSSLSGQAKWARANRFHIQMGGYTSIVESDGKVFFGTDYQGGTNFIVESRDGMTFTRKVVPDPYRRSPIDNMVLRTSRRGTEIWANLPYSSAASKCVLMFSRDAGNNWLRAVEYSRSTHVVWLISSSRDVADVLYVSIENVKSKHRAVYKIGDYQ